MRQSRIILMIPFFWTAGCGIKGDPLPPAEQETIQKQEVPKPLAPTSTPSTSEEKKKIKK